MAAAILLSKTQACLAGGTVSDSRWKICSPEEAGFDSAILVEMFDFVRQHQIPVHSVQIVRHGRLAMDAYFYPFQTGMRHDVASVTKSVTSTLVGLAMEKGYLHDLHQSVVSLYPGVSIANFDSRKRMITLEHLLTMQAGWDCGVDMQDPRINLDSQLAAMRETTNWVQFALNMPMAVEPGIRFAYCNANCHLLSALLSQATGSNALAFARRELFEPLGIRDLEWAADPQGNNYGWSDLQLHPRDMAKLGQMLLQHGRWEDHQIVPESWLAAATSAHVHYTGNNDHYGYYWWVPGEKYPGVFEAVGRGGQRITVWPARDLVIVFTGGGFDPGDLAQFVLKAFTTEGTLPKNRRALAQLQERISAASRPPPSQPKTKPPDIAGRISKKQFTLSSNNLKLTALRLEFNRSAEAKAEFLWDSHRVQFPVGLDNVPRFSNNPLVKLPQVAKGHWLNGDSFQLELDLVGGINCYLFTFRFSEEGRKVYVALKERTGLNEEQFTGTTSE